MIEILQAQDMTALKEFISLPEIWENLHDADISPEHFMPETTTHSIWLLVVVDKKIGGVIGLHHDNSYTLKVHPYVLSEHVIESRNIMKHFYTWFLEHIPKQIIKLITSIPTSHKKVINFAKRVGFEMEGNNTKSYIKDGKVYDQINFGMTRTKMQEIAA